MSGKIKNFKYFVSLNQCLCTGTCHEEKREYQLIINDINSSSKKESKVAVTTKQVPRGTENNVRKIHTVLEQYEQVYCNINNQITRILINKKNRNNYIMHSHLLEQIQDENARKLHFSTGNIVMTLYPSYGFQYEEEGCMYEYQGFLTQYERNLFCFEKTGTMIHNEVTDINMHLEGIDKVLTKNNSQNQKNISNH